MVSKVKINDKELDKVLEEIKQDRIDWTNMLRDMIAEKAPHGVTGHLGLSGSWPVTHSDDESHIMASREGPAGIEYWKWVNYGAEWPNKGPPTIKLPISQFLGPMKGKKMKKQNHIRWAMSKKSGEVLVPIFWEWADKVAQVHDIAERYVFCWNLWDKFKREGMKGQYFVEEAINEMLQESNLYKLTKSKYAEVKPR